MGEREQIIAVASTYLDAGLTSDDADGVLLAPDCRRWTQRNYHGPPRDSDAEAIRAGIRRGDEKGITRIDNRRWVVDGNQAVVLADIHFAGLDEPIILYERFLVEDGMIREIEGIFVPPPRALGR